MSKNEEPSSSSNSSSGSVPIDTGEEQQHQLLVAQFLEIVGDLNVARATDILQSCGWNLEENSAIIWATIDTRMEAQMLKRRILRCTELPHLSIYAPTATSTQDGFNTLIDQPPFLNRQYQENRLEGFHLVGSLEGAIDDVDKAVVLLANAIEFMQFEKMKNDRLLQKLEDDRKLRLEQDQAYAAAVEKDRKLAIEAKEEEQRRERELLGNREKEKENEMRKQQKKETYLRLRNAQCLRGRNFFREQLITPSSQDTVRVRVRLSDGVRLERKFPRASSSNDIFSWIDGIVDLIEVMQEKFLIEQIAYIEEVVINDDYEIRSKMVYRSDQGELVSMVLGDISSPGQQVPQIPLHYYLSTPFPVKKIERPVAEYSTEESTDTNTLQELRVDSDTALFLHPCIGDNNNKE